MALLNSELRQQFDRDGYLLLRDVLPREALSGVIRAIENAVDRRAKNLLREGTITNLHENEPFQLRWQRIVADMGNRQTRRSWDDEVIDESVFDLMRHPAVLDVVESLIGPEITATGMIAVRPKVPGDKRTTVLWHQDSQYLGTESQSQTILTVWLPLVRSDERNGCMQVIPGSNHWGLQAFDKDEEANVLRPLEDPEQRGHAQTCEMEAGDLLVFNNLTYHRSIENHSDHTRWSIDLRYCSPETTFVGASRYIPGFLARSRSRQAESWETWQAKVLQWQEPACA